MTHVKITLQALAICFLLGCNQTPKPDPEPSSPEPPKTTPCTAPAAWFPTTPQPMDFKATINCDFHQWAWQQFLWLTQPSDANPSELNYQTLAWPHDLFVDNPTAYPGRSESKLRIGPRVRKTDESQNLEAIKQAGSGDVLVDQSGNLVYYTAAVNDVYYNFIKDNGFNLKSNILAADPKLDFPTTGAGSLEIKIAWRIAVMDGVTYIPNQQDFITTQAEVEYWEFKDNKWVDSGTMKEATVTMVGMHVTGTIPNHPEFIWATFEHVDNAPICAATSGGNIPSTNPATGNRWSFYPGNLDCPDTGSCNQGSTVDKDDGEPNPVCLVDPNGGGNAENQTNITTLNASVLQQLGDDVRHNYFYGGGIWTNNGELPPTSTNERGSLKVENTTMETFFQGELNCFSCHNTNPYSQDWGTTKKNIFLSHLLQLAQ